MALGVLFQAIYASLLGQAVFPGSPSPPPVLFPSPSATPPAFGPGTGSSSRPLVASPHGSLLGVQTRTASSVVVESFLGIPFAQPPTGKLRFQEPQSPQPWTGVRDASTFGNECHERHISLYTFNLTDTPLKKSEDCLYLNVYRPAKRSGGLLPVMVWIHGGGFALGAGSQYEGSELAARGVILVTINYRLEVFGFLSNQDDVIPGNYGMLDQVMALKWVHDSIQAFGGDPNLVTVFGESAGSASVSLLVLSPLAKGLFQRAIMESGSSLSPWGVTLPASRITPRQIVGLISSRVGCTDIDAAKKLDCLRNVDAKSLLNASLSVGNALQKLLLMSPVVETKFGFLPNTPAYLWTQNKFNHVDTIRGFNKAENAAQALAWGNYSISPKKFTNGIRQLFADVAVIGRDELVQDMTKSYVGNKTDGHEILLELAYAISDISFKGPALLETNIESNFASEKKHYVYEFDHKPGMSLFPSWMPATHADEIQFVFGVCLRQFKIPGRSPTAEDQTVSTEVQTWWTNFAKYGDPTRSVPMSAVQWDTYNADTVPVLRINTHSQVLSYKTHKSLQFYPMFLKKLDSSLPDNFIVG